MLNPFLICLLLPLFFRSSRLGSQSRLKRSESSYCFPIPLCVNACHAVL
jgi:hypothetical protein